MEQWRDVAQCPNYEVSSLGRVRRKDSGIVLKGDLSRGYVRVGLWTHCTYKRAMVHALVARAFIGPKPDGHEHNHRDGNRQNNRVENIEYVTPSENQHHKYKVLGNEGNKGEKHPLHKLTDAEVTAIRAIAVRRGDLPAIARRFGVSVPTISMIRSGKTWRHLVSPV